MQTQNDRNVSDTFLVWRFGSMPNRSWPPGLTTQALRECLPRPEHKDFVGRHFRGIPPADANAVRRANELRTEFTAGGFYGIRKPLCGGHRAARDHLQSRVQCVVYLMYPRLSLETRNCCYKGAGTKPFTTHLANTQELG